MSESDEDQCCRVSLRRVILFFCFIFFIWSVALIGLGTVKTSAFSFLVTDAIQVGALVFGIILLTVSTLGCWGAWKQYRMLIITFAVLVGLQIVCEMAVGGIFLSRRGKVSTAVRLVWDSASNFQRVSAQNSFLCCGWSVYNATAQGPGGRGATGLAGQPCPDPFAFPDSVRPCSDVILPLITDNYASIGGVIIGVALSQIVAFVVSVVLLCRIRNQLTHEHSPINSDSITLTNVQTAK